MNKIIDKLKQGIDIIGKQNIFLIVFVLIVLGISGLYNTFSIYTASEGVSIIDGIKTYKFILGEDTKNSILVASGKSKNIEVTITNDSDLMLNYGVYYSSYDDLTDVSIRYLGTSSSLPQDVIEGNSNNFVTLLIENQSDDDVTIDFGVKYGLKSGGDLTLDSNEYWIESKLMYLSEVKAGSYVKYVGNNGCVGEACNGQNANYVSDEDMGYCGSQSTKFITNGWRIAYTKDKNAYLISAGAPECLATDKLGNISSDTYGDVDYEAAHGMPVHINNLNKEALKYCNSNYSENGECSNNTIWAFKESDFKIILNSDITLTDCYFKDKDNKCGYDNDLINNGFYWFANPFEVNTSFHGFNWNIADNMVSSEASNENAGLRVVIKLDSTVQVIGGSGTYSDPYKIRKREKKYLKDANVGSYVSYNGNNDCVGEACKGQNANYVSDENMGYCGTDSTKFKTNGWRIGYIEGKSSYLISAGAPECFDNKEDSNINDIALKYCNSSYSFNGRCDKDNVWAMNSVDFSKITGNVLGAGSCYEISGNNNCGYNNDLIDIGSFYWYDTLNQDKMFYWNPNLRFNSSDANNYSMGVRPVLKLREDVEITSGEGSYKNPYKIVVNDTKIKDLSGNDHYGINNGGNWDKTSGVISLNGNSSYIDCGLKNYNFGGSVSLVTRININEFNENKSYLLSNSNNGGVSLIIDEEGRFGFEIYTIQNGIGSYKYFSSGFVPSLNTWYTVVAIYDGMNLSLFVDGESINLDSNIIGAPSSVNGNVGISNNLMLAGNTGDLKLDYDDILIFNRSLSSDEVQSNYSGKVNPENKDGLVLYYNFE